MCLGWLCLVGSIALDYGGCVMLVALSYGDCVGSVVFGRLPSNQKQIFCDIVIHCDTA